MRRSLPTLRGRRVSLRPDPAGPASALAAVTAEAAAHVDSPWWFGVLTGRLLRRDDFTSRDDLEAKITAFTIRHNKNARPCKWNYDADAEHARYLRRHPQPETLTALPEAA
jgi:hypothetical protein